MNDGGKNKLENRIWLARKRASLEQKQIAYLLGHKGLDQISRYENDKRPPSFENALKLEIILGTPVRLLFPETYQRLRSEVKMRAEGNIALKDVIREISGDDLCPYMEFLSAPAPSEEELEKARRHAVEMVNRVSDRWNEYRNRAAEHSAPGGKTQPTLF